MIIDTHIHIWDLENLSYEWIKGNDTILNRTYHFDEIEKDRKEVGVTAGVLVQAENHFDDTNWMLINAEKYDWIKGVVGWLPLMNPTGTAEALKHYLSNPYFKGVRHLIHDEPDPKWLLRDEVIESLKILADHAVPFDVVGVLNEHIVTALKVAEKVPELKMVFDHLNQPPISTRKFGQWGELMKEAANHSNFYQKISGQGTASINFDSWIGEDIRPYVGFVLEHFSTDRCFCGGDWPVSLLAGSYTKTWTTYKDVLSEILTAKDQQKVLWESARNFYKLEL
ncbi:MAG: amidohydrolase family protein [Cyclobacteriaceae bacterium]